MPIRRSRRVINDWRPLNSPLLANSKEHEMGLVAVKPVFGVSDQVMPKLACSVTETSYNSEISPLASFNMILSNKRIINALIRLRVCAGWSASLLFANHRRQVFSRRGPLIILPLDDVAVEKNVFPEMTKMLVTKFLEAILQNLKG